MISQSIRQAEPGDIPRLVAMGLRFLATSEYALKLERRDDAISTLMARLITDENGILLVGERRGAIIGMMGLFISPHPISGERTAAEVFWWVEPEHRGLGHALLRAGEAKAVEAGATLLQMTAPNARVARFYEKIGYSKLEEQYMRRV